MLSRRSVVFAGTILLLFSLYGCSVMENLNSLMVIDQVETTGFTIEETSITDSGPVPGGTLNVYTDYIDNLNPLFTKNENLMDHYSLVFSSLFKVDASGNLIPLLAEKWQFAEDMTSLIITMKDDISWHDGNRFTAADVEFTLDTIKLKDVNQKYKDRLLNVSGYTVIDSNTLKIVLKEADPFILYKLNFPIIPMHFYRYADPGREKSMAPGTGLFTFEKYEEDSGIVLQRFRNKTEYEISDSEEPVTGIEQVHIKIINDKTPLEALLVREVDIIKIRSNKFAGYENRTDANIYEYTCLDCEMIVCNTEDNIIGSANVRKAISLMIDRDKIISEVLGRKAEKIEVPLNNKMWIANRATVPATSLQKAMELLEADGWAKEDGVLVKRINGRKTKFKIELLVNIENFERVQEAYLIKEDLEKAGVEVVVTELTWPDLYENMKRKKFQLALTGYRIPEIPNPYPLYTGVNAGEQSVVAGNFSGYSNPELDELARTLKISPSISKQRFIMGEIMDIISNDVPYIGICIRKEAVLVRRKVRGSIDPYYLDMYNCIDSWYLIE